MALKLPKELNIVEGDQVMRRDEGLVFSVDVSNQTSTTPSSATVTIIRQRDESDVTSAFMAVNSPSISSSIITLDEILVPSNAETGDYIVTVEYEAGSHSPGRPWFKIVVYE